MRASFLQLALVMFPALGLVQPLAGQASPLLPVDDPRLPLLEHLIARGDVDDPSPMQRPFKRSVAAEALSRGRFAPRSASAGIARTLLEAFGTSPNKGLWSIRGAAGAQGFSQARRELLQPAGDGGVKPFGEVGGEAAYGVLAGGVRAAYEPRLALDPDWMDSTSTAPREARWRMPEAYAMLDLGWGRVTAGQYPEQLGPNGLAGIPLGTDAYPRPVLSLEARLGPVQLLAEGSNLRQVSAAIRPERYRSFVMHRAAVTVSPALHFAVWESGLVSTTSGGAGSFFVNPLRPLLLSHLFGTADDQNVMFGLDATWRPVRTLRLEAQGALDDVGSDGGDGAKRPARWAASLGAAGALGRALSWQARVTAATSLVYRTHRPEEYYTDGGIGLGRNFADQVLATVQVGIPVRSAWLVSPELAFLRQGEGRLDAPFPTGSALADTPTFFIGTPRTTWRAGAHLAGQRGPVALSGFGGVHHSTNVGNISGRTETGFEGRLQATLGFSLGGPLR